METTVDRPLQLGESRKEREIITRAIRLEVCRKSRSDEIEISEIGGYASRIAVGKRRKGSVAQDVRHSGKGFT